MQLFTPLATQPAGVVVLKPIAAKATVPNIPSYAQLRVTNYRSSLPAPWKNERRMRRRRSCPTARTKAHDEAEPELQAPEKEGEEEEAAKRKRGHRNFAYQIFESVFLCVCILSWRIGDVIVYNAQDSLKRLRGYVLDKFNQKR